MNSIADSGQRWLRSIDRWAGLDPGIEPVITRNVLKALRWARAPAIPDIPREFAEVPRRNGRLVVTGLGLQGFAGRGKVRPNVFFPPFVYALYREGIETVFVNSIERLERALEYPETCLVHIYNEEMDRRDRLPDGLSAIAAKLVFNRLELGSILGSKIATNRLYASAGIPVPELVTDVSPDCAVFSNSRYGTHRDAWLVRGADELSARRYNTKYVDTQREFGGVAYHTTVRLIAVGRELVHAFVRARPVSDGSPSVHTTDTPREPDMIEHFHGTLVTARWDEHAALAARIGDALGPGFYAHDLLISNEDERVYVCESNLKFHDFTYTDHLFAIAAHTPSNELMFSPEYPRRAALAFLKECRRQGCFEGGIE